MIDSAIFIGTVIIAATQFVKLLSEKVQGYVTILVAVLIGILVALLDTQVGIKDISVAQGILIALSAVGVHSTLSRVGETS